MDCRRSAVEPTVMGTIENVRWWKVVSRSGQHRG